MNRANDVVTRLEDMGYDIRQRSGLIHVMFKNDNATHHVITIFKEDLDSDLIFHKVNLKFKQLFKKGS